MRFSILSILWAALTPAAVFAAGSLGFQVGAKLPDGTCKQSPDYEADFDALLSQTTAKIVRAEAASHCDTAKGILPAAKKKGFQVIILIWPETESSYNTDMDAIQKYATQYPDQVYGISVGSDTLFRKDFTGRQLANRMQTVRSKLNGQFKVGIADSWTKFADGTADPVIKGQPDFLLVHAYAFWQGTAIKNASHTYFDSIMQAYQNIETVSGGHSIELWTGETGWPTTGNVKHDNAVGGPSPASQYWSQAVCGMLAWGYNVLYFEAFDENGRDPSPAGAGKKIDESHWGVMDIDRVLKFPLKC